VRASAQHWMYAVPEGAQAPAPICRAHLSSQSTCKAPHDALREQTTPQASATDRLVLVKAGAGEAAGPSAEGLDAGAESPGLAFGSSTILPPHAATNERIATIETRRPSGARVV
jgi:hypothetical protein